MSLAEKSKNASDDETLKEKIIREEAIDTQAKDEEDNRNQFMKEASEVNVPTSILMNQFRDNLNQCIERSQLHVECILEILRTACVSMEQTAAEIAAEEYSVYSGKIEELKKKYNIE